MLTSAVYASGGMQNTTVQLSCTQKGQSAGTVRLLVVLVADNARST